eukprot:1182712-Rhodomonas_salina.5
MRRGAAGSGGHGQISSSKVVGYLQVERGHRCAGTKLTALMRSLYHVACVGVCAADAVCHSVPVQSTRRGKLSCPSKVTDTASTTSWRIGGLVFST